MIQSTKLSNLQLEFLKLFSRGVSDEELFEIRSVLADYFANKLTTEAAKIWNEKGLSNDDMDKCLKELS